MTTFAVAMVKDEADIVGETVTRMLAQVDGVIVADNGSTDGTREILEGLPITVVDDPEVAYYQSFKMTQLAARAATMGADWVVPFDADEIWYSPFGRIADLLDAQAEEIVPATLYDHIATAADRPDPNPVARLGWRRRDRTPLPKVACRPHSKVVIEQGNHSATYTARIAEEGRLIVRHFPYRSPEQMIRKARNGAAAYAATNLPYGIGQHWRDYGCLSDDHLHEVFHTWFHSADPGADGSLIYDPAP